MSRTRKLHRWKPGSVFRRRGRLKRKCRGMNLLELVIASSMFAVILVSVVVVLRTGRQAWEAHREDMTRVEAAHATMRHIVRQVRQADRVAAISTAADTSGNLALVLPSGQTVVWDHDALTNQVNYGVSAATDLLSPQIAGLRFIGYRADGVTQTTIPSEVQAIEIEVTAQLPAGLPGTGIVHSWAWIRSW